MKSSGPFIRPPSIEPGGSWVSVAAVHKSDGAHPDEKTWGIECICNGSTERCALRCAEDWFDDTDQSEDAEITLSMERSDGTIVSHRVRIETAPRARLVEGPRP